MKVVIHGTNGGYKSLNSLGTFNDVRPDNNKKACIGQESYSIQYFESNVVFSKYLFVRDVLGDKRTGNIAFSLVIPQSKKLSGEYIIEILDKVSDEFEKRHIDSDNLDSFREDWKFIEEIIRDYDILVESNRDEVILNSGSKESGFIYFNGPNSLKEYFQLPYQEEYTELKQVFLIDNKYEGKDENPLNALRHDSNSNLTDRIDLNKYTLKYNTTANNGNSTVKVTVNSINKKKLSLDETLEIEISEDYKVTEQITSPIQHSQYIKIDNKAKIVSVEITKFDLNDNSYDFEFKIQNENGEDLNENFEINYFSSRLPNLTTNDNNKWIKSEDYKLTIKEKELAHNNYFVYIKTKSGSASSFIREIKKEDSRQIINIKVRSNYKQKIEIRKERSTELLNDCEITFGEKKGINNEVILDSPNEITKIWDLKIDHPNYDSHVEKDFHFAENEIKPIYLLNNKIRQIDKTRTREKPKSIDIPNKGTQVTKKNNLTKTWIIPITLFIFLGAGIFRLLNYLDKPSDYDTDTSDVEIRDTTINDVIQKDGDEKPEKDDEKPASGDIKSNLGKDKLKVSDDKPKAADNNPKEGTNKPKAGDNKTKPESDKPKLGDDLKNSDNVNSKSFENEFWKYINMNEPKRENFQKLLKKVNKLNFKYYAYLEEISKKNGFEKFKKIEEEDRIKAKYLKDIPLN